MTSAYVSTKNLDNIRGTPKRATVTTVQDDDDDYYECEDRVQHGKEELKGNFKNSLGLPGETSSNAAGSRNCLSSCTVCGKTGIEVCEGRNLKKNACNKIDCCIWNFMLRLRV